MDTNARVRTLPNDGSRFAGSEQRLRELGIKPRRLVCGVASIPLGTPVELEVIFKVAA